jgi:protein SCO1/2
VSAVPADSLGVEVDKVAMLPSGGYQVAHGSQIVATDERVRSPIVKTEGTSVQKLAENRSTLLGTTDTESRPTT